MRQSESEPTHVGNILPGIMAEIQAGMKARQAEIQALNERTNGNMNSTLQAVPSTFASNVTPMLGHAPRAVSRKTAAEALSVSEKTVERLINRGELAGFRVGWKWRVMLCDLESYVARQQAAERQRIGK